MRGSGSASPQGSVRRSPAGVRNVSMPGISPADLKRVFEPFVRGSQPADEGTGLGLSIVKRIVERLKGSVVLENVPKSGLRATVSLPASGL